MNLQYLQDLMIIVFGLVGIVILLVVLRHVHKQSQKVQELKTQLNLPHQVEDAEVATAQQEINS